MECIEILDSDEEAAAAAAAPPEPESDDDVEIVGGAPAPALPDSQDSEVQILDDAADLSEGAQAKLLKSLLAEKQQLAQQVASLQKKTSDDKRAKRPVYWRRGGCRGGLLVAVEDLDALHFLYSCFYFRAAAGRELYRSLLVRSGYGRRAVLARCLGISGERGADPSAPAALIRAPRRPIASVLALKSGRLRRG